jgi:hypothetical protein
MEGTREHRNLTVGMGSVMERTAPAPLQPRARITGVVYLAYFLFAIGTLFTPATPKDIVAHEPLFRLEFAVGLISLGLYVALTALFYNLFRPVNRNLALVAGFLGLTGCAVQALGSVFQLAPLVVLGGSHYSSVFNADQLQSLAQMFLDLNAQAGAVGIVFFAVFDIVIGYLIFQSTFLPRILGALIVSAGLGWLTFLSPLFANYVLTPIEVLGFLAELALMLWLLVRGVNVQRWQEQAGVTGPQLLVR